MDLDRLYTPTILKKRIDLECHEIDSNIGQKLERKLQQDLHGKCIQEGYIKPGSIKLEKKSRGRVRPAHFTGKVTYDVHFKTLVYIPTYGSIVKARVKNNNKAGMLAVAEPLQIIIARQGQFNQDLKLFDQYRIGDIVNVQLLTFRLEPDYIFAVGKLESLVIETDKTYQLPSLGGMNLGNLQIVVRSTNSVPALNTEAYGDPEPLNLKKTEIDPYNEKPQRLWERFIRYFINPYELLANRAYNIETVIRFQKVWKSNGNGGSWVPTGSVNGIEYEPFSRAYYKLREILYDFPPPGNKQGEASILDRWRLKPIRVLNLAEGPGGFIHCTIDTRGTSGQAMLDDYLAITLRKPNQGSRVKDWDSEAQAKSYFNTMRAERGAEKIKTIYGPNQDSNGDLTDPEIIKYIMQQYQPRVLEPLDEEDDAIEGEVPAAADGETIEETGAHFITADGAIDVSSNYNLQEMFSYQLFYAEILTAIGSQRDGGCFVIKIYDIYTDVTAQFLVLLQHFYETVHITKPNTSRPANSEKYVVCQDFKGFSSQEVKEQVINRLMTGLEEWKKLEKEEMQNVADQKQPGFYIISIMDTVIPQVLKDTIRLNNEKFVERQIKKIDEGIDLIKTGNIANRNVQKNIKTNQKPIAFKWCQAYLGDSSCNTGIKINTHDIPNLPIASKDGQKKMGKIIAKQ